MTTRALKPATVRFYFDADVLGLAKVINKLRADITYPGDEGGLIHRRLRAACPITTDAPDVEWIPQVAARQWLIITRDNGIQSRGAETEAVLAHGAQVVALAGRDAVRRWDQLEILMCQWRRIEALVGSAAPAIYRATRTSFTAISLR